MDAFVQVIVSGLTLGGMYAVSVIGLALVWGVVGMLNMAHGAMLAIGGYASLVAVQYLGLPWMFGLPAAVGHRRHRRCARLLRHSSLDGELSLI